MERRRGSRAAQTAATHVTAIHPVAVMATSCSQSNCTEWGHRRPTMAMGHIASSKWLCQNG